MKRAQGRSHQAQYFFRSVLWVQKAWKSGFLLLGQSVKWLAEDYCCRNSKGTGKETIDEPALGHRGLRFFLRSGRHLLIPRCLQKFYGKPQKALPSPCLLPPNPSPSESLSVLSHETKLLVKMTCCRKMWVSWNPMETPGMMTFLKFLYSLCTYLL